MHKLAVQVGVTDSYIAQMETGRANPPKGEVLHRIGITPKPVKLSK
jgi:predicted transcriptional regulator